MSCPCVMALSEAPKNFLRINEMSEIRQLAKPARPAHVITLSDTIRKLQDVPELRGLVVLWAYEDPDDATVLKLGSHCLGTDPMNHFLASRYAAQVLIGAVDREPAPSDTPPHTPQSPT
jgi:hypothetical protein